MQKAIVKLEDITWKAYYFRNLLPRVHLFMNKFYLQNIEKSYVIDLLKSIDATKSAGLDIIPLGLVKEEAEQIALQLAALINRSLQSGAGCIKK